MNRIFFVGILILLSNFLHSSEIEVRVPQFKGEFIRLYTIDDFISFVEEKEDVVKLDDRGNATLRWKGIRPALIKLRVRDITASLLVLPHMKVEVRLDYDEGANQGRIFDRSFDIKFLNDEGRKLNEALWAYQKEYAAFVEENERNLLTKKMIPQVQAFRDQMMDRFGNEGGAYFKTFLTHDLGALEDAVLGSEETLYKLYFQDRPILYENMGYMQFFVQFYQERFIQISQGKDGLQVLSAVNGTQDFDKLKDIVKKHKYIWNDESAELLIVLGMKEVYGDETFKKKKVLNMLENIAVNGLFADNRRLARNIFEEINYLKPGEAAPDFSLKNLQSEVFHLSDIERNTLLFFWSANSPSCLRELKLLNDYQLIYEDKLQVVAINMDHDPVKAERLLLKEKVDYLSLFMDAQYDVKDKYRIYSVPTYGLIDRNHRILQYPAQRPEENLEETLRNLDLKRR